MKIGAIKQHFQTFISDFDSIDEVKERLLNLVLIVTSALLMLSAVGTIPQIKDTGFSSGYIMWFAFIGLVMMLALIRNWLTYKFKVFALLMAFHFMAFTVLWYLGLFGASVILFMESLIFAIIFFGGRAGLLSIFATLATYIFVGISITSGWHTFSFDFNALAVAPSIWASRFINVTVTLILLGLIVYLMLKALTHSEKNYRSIFNATTDAIFIHDMETGTILNINQGMLDMFGFTAKEVKNLSVADLSCGISPYSQEEAMAWMRRSVEEGPQSFEWLSKRKDGALFWTEINLKPTRIGEWEGIMASARDITGHKEIEANLRKTVGEKDVLLKEIHHRVKNNLQAVTGMMSLQAFHIEDERARKALQDSRTRIRTMALIHEDLYQSEDLASINFKNFILKMANNLASTYGADPDMISINLDIEEVDLNMDTALPTALIINELVANALKHAFSENQPGLIGIAFHHVGERKFRLIVSDNGIGIPDNVNIEESQTMGMQLINTLRNQLGSEIVLNTEKGTQFEFLFDEYHEAGTKLY